jgi:cleavage and polyadenylation specificity factor subunit 5
MGRHRNRPRIGALQAGGILQSRLHQPHRLTAERTTQKRCSIFQPTRSQSNLGATNRMSTITTTALQTSYPPILPKSFNGNQPKTIRLYPLSNYTFGTKETQPEEDPSVLARLKRLEEHYVEHGMRRTCEGILVCHEHNHPHILMLQIANAFFKLPGDYLKPEDDEIDGFKMRLNERLAPVGTQFSGEGVNEEWEIGDTLTQWWRPNFETFMYPFIPAHVTRPKECKKLYFIQLPRQSKPLFKFILEL